MRINVLYQESLPERNRTDYGKRKGPVYFRRFDVPISWDAARLCRALEVAVIAEFEHNSIGNDNVGGWEARGSLKDGAYYILPAITDVGKQKEFLNYFRDVSNEDLLYKARALASK